jgi:hypothetical protein
MANFGGAGTKDTRVDRPEEGLPGLATTTNPTANPPTRATFDAGISGVRGPAAIGSKGDEAPRPTGNIDTQFEANGLTMDQAIKRGQPSAW